LTRFHHHPKRVPLIIDRIRFSQPLGSLVVLFSSNGGLALLQSLISLNDKQITVVLDAVKTWCDSRNVVVDSHEGRRAVTAAVDLVCNHAPTDLLAEMTDRLN
jgi:hypothetical protein